MRPYALTGKLESILERAGLPNIRFHDLRHTCATLLLSRGSSQVRPRAFGSRHDLDHLGQVQPHRTRCGRPGGEGYGRRAFATYCCRRGSTYLPNPFFIAKMLLQISYFSNKGGGTRTHTIRVLSLAKYLPKSVACVRKIAQVSEILCFTEFREFAECQRMSAGYRQNRRRSLIVSPLLAVHAAEVVASRRQGVCRSGIELWIRPRLNFVLQPRRRGQGI